MHASHLRLTVFFARQVPVGGREVRGSRFEVRIFYMEALIGSPRSFSKARARMPAQKLLSSTSDSMGGDLVLFPDLSNDA
jgi:hypothetical protein